MKNMVDSLFVWFEGLDLRLVQAKFSLSTRTRLRLYRKIASLSRTGMPLPRALDAIWLVASLGGKKPEVPLAFAIDAWRKRVYDGHSFGKALKGWVPDREWTIVDAGAGDLGHALDTAADLIENSRRMTNAIFTAVGYPTFLGGMLCILLWIFSVEAIPAFSEVKPVEKWLGLAASVGALSNVVRIGLIPFLTIFSVAVGGIIWSFPIWTGAWRARFDRMPPWSFYCLVMGTSFLASLVAFLRAGMPVPEALRRLRATANPWLRERIDATLYYVNSGYDLGEALHHAGYQFPAREIVEDLRIYATLGNLDASMNRISSEWTKHSLDNLRATGDVMKVVGMALIAATIAWVQLGIIAVQQQLTNGL